MYARNYITRLTEEGRESEIPKTTKELRGTTWTETKRRGSSLLSNCMGATGTASQSTLDRGAAELLKYTLEST